MAATQEQFYTIEEFIDFDTKREITGRNVLARDLYEYLFARLEFDSQPLILSTEKGLILSYYAPSSHKDCAGYTINPEFFHAHREGVTFRTGIENLTLITTAAGSEMNSKINQLQSNLKMLLAIFDANKGREEFFLSCLDAIDSAVCIYDKDAHLLFGNKSYFDNLHIFDKEAVIGLSFADITKETGLKIQATKSGSSKLKMLDVLRSGNKILDWEVRVESQNSPNKAQFVSNNMYPIKNRSGNVEGMIEIASSHQVNLNKTKKLMGLSAEYTFDSIIGESLAIENVVEQAKKYSSSIYNLLIHGESGVGKELFAQSVHNYSSRSHEPFVALNCATFPEHLIESELFGYVGGAFTGASPNGQMGKFELADGGTLFLDEIGELPFHFQSKLLRVLETLEITRIGSTNSVPVNVRMIAATNRDLKKMVSEGLFREDLYYRLQVLSIKIPPLRERQEDLLLLANAFFKQIAEANGDDPKVLGKEAKRCLLDYDWPGNVRELRNVIQRISLLSKANVVTRDEMESTIYSTGYELKGATKAPPGMRIAERKQDVINANRRLAEEALEITNGNKTQAAILLGMSRKTFYRLMEKYMDG